MTNSFYSDQRLILSKDVWFNMKPFNMDLTIESIAFKIGLSIRDRIIRQKINGFVEEGINPIIPENALHILIHTEWLL